ncbi:D-alanyl-D-alanine carboxypeptidase [Aquirufa sp. ROCK-SH2]
MTPFRLLILFCSLLFLGSCAQQKMSKTLTEVGLSNAYMGILIEDIKTGQKVVDLNSNQYFMPASNAKLLTFLMAKRILSDSIPFVRVQETKDSLFFWGTGEPTLLRDGFKNSTLLSYLAQKNQVLVYSDQANWSKPLGEGWSWDDYNDYYSAEINTLPIYGNLMTVKKGNNAWMISPNIFTEGSATTLLRKGVVRDRNVNRLELPGEAKIGAKQWVPFLTSTKLTAQLLQDTLHRKVVYQPKDFDSKSHLIYSNHLDSLLIPMLYESDNHIAEQLLYVIAAQKNWQGPTDKIIAQLKKEYSEDFLQSVKWVDGSGLSRYNLFRPQDLIHVLKALHQEVGMDHLQVLLPESGKSGTLKNVQLMHPKAKIWAKSGSFSNTYNLSGFYQNQKGRTFVFSILTNLSNQPVSKSKKSVIAFLEKMLEIR